MSPVEEIAGRSRWRGRHPAEGLALAGALLLATIGASYTPSLLLAAALSTAATLLVARPPWRLYAGLWLGILPFLAASAVALSLQWTEAGLAFTPGGIQLALATTARALAASSAALLLASVHPASSWLGLLGTSSRFGDLFSLASYTLKAIALFANRAASLTRAASWRMGKRRGGALLVTTALVASRIWELSWRDIQGWHYGMLARCGDGVPRTLPAFPPASRLRVGLALLPAIAVAFVNGWRP
jgi:cobalt/nickel transport system permease protein